MGGSFTRRPSGTRRLLRSHSGQRSGQPPTQCRSFLLGIRAAVAEVVRLNRPAARQAAELEALRRRVGTLRRLAQRARMQRQAELAWLSLQQASAAETEAETALDRLDASLQRALQLLDGHVPERAAGEEAAAECGGQGSATQGTAAEGVEAPAAEVQPGAGSRGFTYPCVGAPRAAVPPPPPQQQQGRGGSHSVRARRMQPRGGAQAVALTRRPARGATPAGKLVLAAGAAGAASAALAGFLWLIMGARSAGGGGER